MDDNEARPERARGDIPFPDFRSYTTNGDEDRDAISDPGAERGVQNFRVIVYSSGACPDCRGRGSILLQVSTVPCTRCNGTGLLGDSFEVPISADKPPKKFDVRV